MSGLQAGGRTLSVNAADHYSMLRAKAKGTAKLKKLTGAMMKKFADATLKLFSGAAFAILPRRTS